MRSGCGVCSLSASLTSPAEESDVLRLLVWAELDQPEIADALAIPLGTVKSRLSRARGRLQAALSPSPDLSTANPPHPES